MEHLKHLRHRRVLGGGCDQKPCRATVPDVDMRARVISCRLVGRPRTPELRDAPDDFQKVSYHDGTFVSINGNGDLFIFDPSTGRPLGTASSARDIQNRSTTDGAIVGCSRPTANPHFY